MIKNFYASALTLASCLCFYLLPAQQIAPSIVWKKVLGGSGDDMAQTIIRTTDGGYLIGGSSTSNDGDVSGHHGSAGTTDAWVVKLDQNGNVQWNKSYGGTGADQINLLSNTSDGGYIGIGYSASTDGDVTGGHGSNDIWVIKLDHYGTLQWQKTLGGSTSDVGNDIKQTSDSGYILIGSVTSRDGDLAGNVVQGLPCICVARLDQTGSLQWIRTYGGSGGDNGNSILPLASGEYIMSVDAQNADGDFAGAGGLIGDIIVPYVVKLSATGDFLQTYDWGPRASAAGLLKVDDAHFALSLNSVGVCYPESGNALFLAGYDTAFNLYSDFDQFHFYCSNTFFMLGYQTKGAGSAAVSAGGAGFLSAGFTDDPGAPGYHTPADISNPQTDGFVSTVSWNHCYGGSGRDVFNGIVSDDGYTCVAAGFTNSNDGDVSGNHGGYDFFIVKLSNTNMIKGTVFLDYNKNGTRDTGEPLVDDILVQSSKGGAKVASMVTNDVFYNSVDTGTYSTSVQSSLPFYTPGPAVTSTFSSYNNTDSISLYLQPVAGKRDYRISLFPTMSPKPGFNATYTITYINAGTDTMQNWPLKMIKDPRLGFVSATPAQSSVSGDTIFWTISHLSPRDTGMISVQLSVPAPPTVNLGDKVNTTVVIDSTGDLNPADNIIHWWDMAEGSFDPNEKDESNGGIVSAADLAAGKSLLYTIHFQNTGTDTAYRVVIRDTLSSQVDVSTLEMVGSSHPYQLQVTNGNILTWTFPNILLADSIHNEKASHGYVAYRIRPAGSVAAGDTIRNTAAIYFDFNLPVATNTQVTAVTNMVSQPLPVPSITGLDSNYCSNDNVVRKIRITNIPVAPATGNAKIDNDVLSIGTDSSCSFIPSSLAAGAHKLIVTYANGSGSDSAAWRFSVITAASPAVRLTGSVTTITSLASPVTLTATATAGAGNMPLYTFAGDRSFTSIWQAEGASNVYMLDPATLAIGNNSAYVRMKTSDSCYTSLYAVDSIVLVRSPITGLTDIDYPSQEIGVNPNPFVDGLAITGLQIIKQYTISLLNSNGQLIITRAVEGQTGTRIDTGAVPAGVYLLRIYDKKKNRPIGSVKVVKLGI